MPTVTSNGTTLNYIREGGGAAVLLLPGYLFDAGSWRPQIDALRDSFDVVALDLRGQFGSETTADGYDLWNQAEDIRGVIEALELGPVHLVGLSMGGMIGMRLALRHPGLVRSLVLMDTSAAPEDPERVERYEAMMQVVEAGHIEAVLPAMPPIFLADDFVVAHREQVDGWLAQVGGCDPAGLVRAIDAVNKRDDISGRLGEIRVPALVIHGEQDVAIPVDQAQEVAARIPGGRLALVSGGHQSNVDRPDATSRLIREFLLDAAVAQGR
jgi:pimeloyl-ACP methyl ester carboxylesterase